VLDNLVNKYLLINLFMEENNLHNKPQFLGKKQVSYGELEETNKFGKTENIKSEKNGKTENFNPSVHENNKIMLPLTQNFPALKFQIIKRFNRARASILSLPHGEVLTPIYMPVGTKAAMKGLLSADLSRMGCRLMLSNTYHLTLEPGQDFIWENYKGTHNYMKWDYNILTDSGGFQMVSLAELSKVTEEGVEFQSHIKGDNRTLMLTPEESIRIQNKLGADIIMALDDVLKPTSEPGRMKTACERTIRWLDRCIAAHSRKDVQNLFGIVQGGIDLELRKYCLSEMIKRDLPGYAIGGMAGGETKNDFWKVVDICTKTLPEDKPRYLMGIGYPVDLVICSLLGVDMYDCVFATRTGRFGTAFTNRGMIKLKNEKFKFDFKPIEEKCSCEVCKKYTRSYFNLTMNKNPRAVNLISFHNVYYLLELLGNLRKAILEEKVDLFVEEFIKNQFYYFENGKYPNWVYDALKAAGVKVDFMEDRLIEKEYREDIEDA
jgi:tRNA-guanine transglycosylase